MTFSDTANAKPAAFYGAVFFDGLVCIAGTGGFETATAAKYRA
jgi:hypothetical protein